MQSEDSLLCAKLPQGWRHRRWKYYASYFRVCHGGSSHSPWQTGARAEQDVEVCGTDSYVLADLEPWRATTMFDWAKMRLSKPLMPGKSPGSTLSSEGLVYI